MDFIYSKQLQKYQEVWNTDISMHTLIKKVLIVTCLAYIFALVIMYQQCSFYCILPLLVTIELIPVGLLIGLIAGLLFSDIIALGIGILLDVLLVVFFVIQPSESVSPTAFTYLFSSSATIRSAEISTICLYAICLLQTLIAITLSVLFIHRIQHIRKKKQVNKVLKKNR